MWYRASSFNDEPTCRKTWRELEKELSRINTDMFSVSLIYQSKWCVVTLYPGEGEPLPQVQEVITKHLQKGMFTIVNPGALNTLLKRHLQRRQYGTYKKDGLGLKSEEHEPIALPYGDYESIEQVRGQRQEVIDTFDKRGYPFLEIYAMFYKSQVERDFYNEDTVHPYALKLGEITIEQLLNSDRYMFTDSARAMHKAVTKGDTEWIPPARETWIEQDIPQSLIPGLETRVKAIYLKRMYPEDLYDAQREPFRGSLLDSTYPFRETWSIGVIDEQCYCHLTMLYDGIEEQFQISFDHACPYHACEVLTFGEILQKYSMAKLLELNPPRYWREASDMNDTPEDSEYPLVIPCENCKRNADIITAWLHTAMKQIKGDYALSSNPAPFPVKNLSYTENKKVPRGKKGSHGKPKEKQVTTYVPYTFITYDVSVAQAPASTPETASDQDSQAEQPARLNWFSMHGKGDFIYEKRVQPDLQRHYRLPYFKALVDKVKSGERKSPEGEEYELVQEGDDFIVVGTVRYPNGRYVPMLKPEAKKKVTYKRVIASKYKAEEKPS